MVAVAVLAVRLREDGDGSFSASEAAVLKDIVISLFTSEVPLCRRALAGCRDGNVKEGIEMDRSSGNGGKGSWNDGV